MPIFVKKGGGKDDPWRALSLAVELGGLISEAKAVGFFKNAGATKKPKRRLPPFRDLVRHLIRKNRKGTARDLWKIIPTDQIDGIRIKDYKFYRSGGQRLIALGKGQGYKDLRPVGRTLQFGAFKKRVGMVRKPTAR